MAATAKSTSFYPEYRPHGRAHSPLVIPTHRRVETFAALIHCSSMLLLPCLYFFLWTREAFWPFLITYTIFSYILDDTQSMGNSIYRTSSWFKKQFIFRKFVDYFPRFLDKEEKIGPRYLFTAHPHGVISFGITAALLPSHTLKSSKSFRSLFPGISVHLLTLPTQFLIPFYRDYIMALGVGLVTKAGITSILRRNHSVAIVVGGAHESLFARPGMNRIVLNRRKGFIKLADVAIVPVYVYGENNVHKVYNTTEQPNGKNSKTLKTFLNLQLLLKKYTGFTLPLVNSRSIFNYDFGLLPYKRRMDVITGKPIYIYRMFNNSIGDKVTEEEINYYHEMYKANLIELWEKNKSFATEWDEKLKIVE
ncbi:hypothetical protein PICMEDRAFT_33384 [Pichia membranifaciens NRRL Y-2026]|uniref:Diacylglycerol O-acyltransferase n=1 Tax=Pichia membranifaciens NRRL Y-2026 TaxID=763406 RepID=A0A1E3NLI4_9ASCO|nr:hypothetical protein PICMEDRAFT_33384 [Pichia membranifaciens NRRL Y-2026]ODQ47005.1 hypothetical protein PICMEDRAFT_33384 [Pichia membranifaciens NRRL Y-2026]